MRAEVKGGKKNYLLYTIGLILTCMIFTLCILDAPEYVRCNHLGVCEFLELHANIDGFRETIHKMTSFSKLGKYAFPYFPLWGNHLINKITILPSVFMFIFSRHISPYHNYCISPLPLKKNDYFILNQKHTSSSKENNSPSLPLLLITTSIINS